MSNSLKLVTTCTFYTYSFKRDELPDPGDDLLSRFWMSRTDESGKEEKMELAKEMAAFLSFELRKAFPEGVGVHTKRNYSKAETEIEVYWAEYEEAGRRHLSEAREILPEEHSQYRVTVSMKDALSSEFFASLLLLIPKAGD